MLVRSKFVVAALAACALLVSQATAATVTLTLWLNQDGPGTFNVYGEASPGDNGGIVSYGIPIIGPVLTIDHISPNAQLTSGNGGTTFGSAGFTFLRSADGDAPGLSASQDTITPTPHILYGMGQNAGSFAASGLTPVGPPPEQPVWGKPLLIAKGTYNRAEGELDFGRTSANLLVDVFIQPGTPGIKRAEELILRVIPEPATIALFGLALVGSFGLVRRRQK